MAWGLGGTRPFLRRQGLGSLGVRVRLAGTSSSYLATSRVYSAVSINGNTHAAIECCGVEGG